MINPLSDKELDELTAKVNREKQQGLNAISTIRDRKRNDIECIYPTTENNPNEVIVDLVYRNIQLENSLFLTDEMNIDLVTDEGVLSKDITDKAKKALKYDDENMDLYYMREDIINYNGLYGVAVTIVDGRDDVEIQPISSSIDPLAVIPDPKNWRGSKMRFIGIQRRIRKDSLNDEYYFNYQDVECVGTDDELRKNEDTYNNINGQNSTSEQDGLIDVYDHFTIFDGKVVLTTWTGDANRLIRYVEIRPMTEREKKKPSEIKFPVQIHRRKTKMNSFFGVSIIEEVKQYQDLVTKLMNLQILQARIAALGPDKMVDQDLGMDLSLLGKKLPGGRIIPVQADGKPISNSIHTDVYPNPSQFPTQVRNELETYSSKTTGVTDLTFGTSLPGSQTKAEIQTLQSNSNKILSYIGNNYIRGQKEYREAHYRAYVTNMLKGEKKRISMFDKGEPIALTLRKNDFVTNGNINIYVTSAEEQRIKNEKDVVKLISLANLYLANMKPGYGMNEFLRKIGDTSGIQNFDSTKYIYRTPDEMRAIEYLEGLNRNEEAPMPKEGEDYMTYIQIYSQALDTPAKTKALFAYTQAYKIQGQGMQEQTGNADATTGAMAMNNIVSNQSQQTPSLQTL